MIPSQGKTVLALQGGGALGAYQGLAESGRIPDWVAGISIGAINAAIVSGKPAGNRLARLHDFLNGAARDMPWAPRIAGAKAR